MTVYRHDQGRDLLGLSIAVHGDGLVGRVRREGRAELAYDRASLRSLVDELFTADPAAPGQRG